MRIQTAARLLLQDFNVIRIHIDVIVSTMYILSEFEFFFHPSKTVPTIIPRYQECHEKKRREFPETKKRAPAMHTETLQGTPIHQKTANKAPPPESQPA